MPDAVAHSTPPTTVGKSLQLRRVWKTATRKKKMRQMTTNGIAELLTRIESIVNDTECWSLTCRGYGMKDFEKAIQDCEDTDHNGCEISARSTKSGHSESIEADDNWFEIIADDDDQD